MKEISGELWLFSVDCPQADRVFLVADSIEGFSTWYEMNKSDGGNWEMTHQLNPGRYRFRYYSVEGDTFLNCGTYGLAARRVKGYHPQVEVDAMEPLARTA